MEPSQEIILSIIAGLRDQSGDGLQLAHQSFESLKNNVNTIFCLFDVIMSTPDIIIKQHSVILLEHTFSACTTQINDEIMDGMKGQMFEILTKETDPTFLSTIIYELQIILRRYHSEWPEILELVYSRQGSLLLTLMLMRLIISCYKESLQGKDDFSARLLTDGITSSDVYIIRSTLLLMAEFENQKIISRAQLMQFSPEVINILTATIQRKNPEEYDQLFPVLIQHECLFLFPIESAYNPLTELLSDDSSQIGIKIQAQIVLNTYFYQEEIPQEIISAAPALLELEMNIYESMLRNGETNIEPYFKSTLSCICQMPVPQVSEVFSTVFSNLTETTDAFSLSTGIFFLSSALSFVPEAFDELLGDIYPVILECLGHDEEIVRDAAADALQQTAAVFCDYISGNLTETLEMVLYYMGNRSDEGNEVGPLSAVIRYAENVDSIMKDLFNICLEQISELAPSKASFEYISTIEVLLSKYRNFSEFGGSIFMEINTLVEQNIQQYYHLLRADVAAFCCIAQMDSLTDERNSLLQMLNESLEDEEIRAYTIGAIKHAAIGGILDEQWMAEFSSRLLTIIESNINMDNTPDMVASDTLGAAMDAYICLSKNTIGELSMQNVEVVSTIVGLICNILKLPFPEHVHAWMYQCLCDLCVSISKLEQCSEDELISADLHEIVNLSFSTHLENDFGSVLSFLATAIEMNIIPIMYPEEQRLLEYLPDLLTKFDCSFDGQENVLSKMTDAVHAILKRSESNVVEEATALILPPIGQCLSQDDERIQMNAFLVFTQLLDVFTPEAIPEELTDLVYTLIDNAISSGRPNQATAVASSITVLESYHFDIQTVRDFINPKVEEWATLILQRMSSGEAESSGASLMREYLVAMMCRMPIDHLWEALTPEQILEPIIEVCPITRSIACANHIYMYIPTLEVRISLEKKIPLLQKLIKQFALPDYKIRLIGIESYVQLSIGHWMYRILLKLGEEAESLVSETLEGDEFRIRCVYMFMEHCWTVLSAPGNSIQE